MKLGIEGFKRLGFMEAYEKILKTFVMRLYMYFSEHGSRFRVRCRVIVAARKVAAVTL